jgi:methylated-DNA-[protein]-cysteine S-methyltransferase
MIFYTTFATDLCDIILVGDINNIQKLHLDTGEGKRTFKINSHWIKNGAPFKEAKKQIKAYCRGELIDFSIPLKPTGTDFQIKVWNALQNIPNGETRTYGQIAEEIGNKKGSRAVGMANSKNPIPILIPCHRVIGTNGTLTGFAHGLNIKQKLLTLETEYYSRKS